MQSQLEINLIYRTERGKEIFFADITKGIDNLDIEDYEPESFWVTLGGFEVTINGYQTIFRSTNFNYLVDASSFLIKSLFWIQNKISEWFDIDPDLPADVILRTADKQIIRIQQRNENEIIFSYLPSEKIDARERGDRFFDKVVINKKEWYSQANVALAEYFKVLKKICDDNKNNETSKVMLKYYEELTNL